MDSWGGIDWLLRKEHKIIGQDKRAWQVGLWKIMEQRGGQAEVGQRLLAAWTRLEMDIVQSQLVGSQLSVEQS